MGSLLATGFPYDVAKDPENLTYFERALRKGLLVRRPGAAALDLAYVAAGRLEGFWEVKLNPWDVAAGWLLVEEAGGRVTDLEGEPLPPGQPLHPRHQRAGPRGPAPDPPGPGLRARALTRRGA